MAADVGYSEDTLFSRAVLLRSAVQTLSNLDSRRAYDSSGQTVNVSPQQLPGALVLLQEAGESKLVIGLGSNWLQQHAHDPFAGDVAVTVALAHCDEAAEALDADNGNMVLQACKHLEASLQLLREHKMAVGLQHHIMQTLEDYSPRYCIELLRLPLEEVQPRLRGLSLLRKLAFELPPEVSPLGKDRDDFLSRARTCMLPQEQLDLYKSLPVGARQALQQKLDVALATVAIGYQQRNPRAVQLAASLFKQLQEAATQEGSCLDVTVERAACCLLLGDAQQALQLLGLANAQSVQEQQGSSSQDSIKAFVLEHSPDSSDLLSGVYMLTTAWIQEAVISGFRSEAFESPADQDPADLGQWFESRQVQLYIQVSSDGSLLAQPSTPRLFPEGGLRWPCRLSLPSPAVLNVLTSSQLALCHVHAATCQALTVIRRFSFFAMLHAIPAAAVAFCAWLWNSTVHTAPGKQGGNIYLAAAATSSASSSLEAETSLDAPESLPRSRSASPAPAIVRPASLHLAGEQGTAQHAVPGLPQQQLRHVHSKEAQLSISSPEPAGAPLEVSLRAKLRSRTGGCIKMDDQDKPLGSVTPDRQQQLQALEMQMWDSCTKPAGLGSHCAAKVQQVLPVLLLGAAAAAALAQSKGSTCRPALAAPPAAETLWDTARC